ncbi:Hsp20/alpha crystallin family protein [Mucilaginibacter sp. Mucisp84]|uniref:Hsp20/alpha crystallin family protein n=1 Tax=Mucilaginibacter sp. Mucisp84 TaxID=3243058 RepID=UPI0039A6DBF1
MTALIKSHRVPSWKSMMENFWSPDRFFDKTSSGGEFLPAVNIRETKNHYKLDVAVPGFKKNDFKIITEDGLLIISAETNKEEKEAIDSYTRKEFSFASFRRTFKLPDNVEEDGVNANYHNGLLEIELKKSGRNQAAKKEIKVD